jgi:hypothetical protein
MQSSEELPHEKIDNLLRRCGWIIQNRFTMNLSADFDAYLIGLTAGPSKLTTGFAAIICVRELRHEPSFQLAA